MIVDAKAVWHLSSADGSMRNELDIVKFRWCLIALIQQSRNRLRKRTVLFSMSYIGCYRHVKRVWKEKRWSQLYRSEGLVRREANGFDWEVSRQRTSLNSSSITRRWCGASSLIC